MKIKYFCVLFFLIFIVIFESKIFLLKDYVVFFSVGQGDSALIRINNKNVLIDSGPDWEVLRGLGKYLGFWSKTIDSVIITHAHHDHFIGLGEIIKRYKVKRVYYYKHNKIDKVYDYLVNELNSEIENIEIIKVKKDTKIFFTNNCSLDFLWPLDEEIKSDDLNYLSIVNYLDYRNTRILFSADINRAVEKLLINSYLNLKVDIFQSSHHGSFTGNSLVFLEVIKPKVCVISVGKYNKYGLPSDIIIKRMMNLNIEIRRTDLEGDIIFFFK
ncbi:MBL fold metallo-hydrolase [bacterium]|nr:MBL fold metallo-hydrolase [bacterium]